jgi:hypothetical protein
VGALRRCLKERPLAGRIQRGSREDARGDRVTIAFYAPRAAFLDPHTGGGDPVMTRNLIGALVLASVEVPFRQLVNALLGRG